MAKTLTRGQEVAERPLGVEGSEGRRTARTASVLELWTFSGSGVVQKILLSQFKLGVAIIFHEVRLAYAPSQAIPA